MRNHPCEEILRFLSQLTKHRISLCGSSQVVRGGDLTIDRWKSYALRKDSKKSTPPSLELKDQHSNENKWLDICKKAMNVDKTRCFTRKIKNLDLFTNIPYAVRNRSC